MPPALDTLVPAIYLGAVCVALPVYCVKKFVERNDGMERVREEHMVDLRNKAADAEMKAYQAVHDRKDRDRREEMVTWSYYPWN
jgi:hypothetical protein